MQNYRYHIIVGCFEVENNATKYHEMIMSKYNKSSRSIPILNGKMDAITYKSYKTMREAYNEVQKAKDIITVGAWVMYK